MRVVTHPAGVKFSLRVSDSMCNGVLNPKVVEGRDTKDLAFVRPLEE